MQARTTFAKFTDPPSFGFGNITSELTGFTELDETQDVFEIADGLLGAGACVRFLPSEIKTKHDFFTSVKTVLPLDPPVSGDNWDGLLDSVVGGITQASDRFFAVIWPNSRGMADADPKSYEIARAVLADAVRSVEHPYALSVFLG